jgi:hypothetical protein
MKRPISVFIALALAGVASVGNPRASMAADVTLYELTENMSIRLDDGNRYRKATAALTGWAALGTPLCPVSLVAALNPGAKACIVNATGSDNIDTRSGRGDFRGNLTVVVHGDNPVDAPELVVMKGSFRGDMDFAPALVNGVPYGTVAGEMRLSKDKARYPFTGVFRLPFAGNYAGPETGGATLRQVFCPLTSGSNPYAALFDGYDLAYIGTSNGAPNGTCIDISPKETSLGTSLVRFELTFGGVYRRSGSSD